MKLTLYRMENSGDACTGDLHVDGKYFCHTLEDQVRAPGVKVQDATAIPAGTYTVIVNMSPRFGRLFPRLLEVPMFTGILIHSGNDAVDTKGCILIGSDLDTTGERVTGGSKLFPVLMAVLKGAQDTKDQITIEIKNCFD